MAFWLLVTIYAWMACNKLKLNRDKTVSLAIQVQKNQLWGFHTSKIKQEKENCHDSLQQQQKPLFFPLKITVIVFIMLR